MLRSARALALAALAISVAAAPTGALASGGASGGASASQGASSAQPADPRADRIRTLLETNSEALVTVRFVMNLDTGMGSDEQEMEVGGVMVDPSGLVLVSNTEMGGFAAILARMGRGGARAVPRNIKVLIGDDQEGIDARVVARDTELDLAWVQIKDPRDRTFTAVDFTKSAPMRVGDEVVVLSRMTKFFDRAPMVIPVRVGGVTRKPRELFSAAVETFGRPVFAPTGEALGMVVLVMPSAEEMEAAAGRMSRDDFGGPMLLPAADVVIATARAKEAAAAGRFEEEPAPAPDEGQGEGEDGADGDNADADDAMGDQPADAPANPRH
jgi:S1-C subfamily serine protease